MQVLYFCFNCPGFFLDCVLRSHNINVAISESMISISERSSNFDFQVYSPCEIINLSSYTNIMTTIVVTFLNHRPYPQKENYFSYGFSPRVIQRIIRLSPHSSKPLQGLKDILA